MRPEIIAYIEEVVSGVRATLMQAAERAEKLKKGERLVLTTYADEVAKQQGSARSATYPVIKLALNENYPNCIVKRGNQGGLERMKEWSEVDGVGTAVALPPARDPHTRDTRAGASDAEEKSDIPLDAKPSDAHITPVPETPASSDAVGEIINK
jgi:hypothetical protein